MGQEKNFVRAVILGGGEILDYPQVASKIEPADFIICADSGYRHCSSLGVEPDLLVGDFDSIGKVPKGIPLERAPSEKDFTDTALALECALRKGCTAILAAGMGGGRPDHSLGNLQTMAYAAEKGLETVIIDGISTCTILHAVKGKSITVWPLSGHYFSLLSFSESCFGVTVTGAKYNLERATLTYHHALGVSNEFTGGPVSISLEQGTLLLVTTPKQWPV